MQLLYTLQYEIAIATQRTYKSRTGLGMQQSNLRMSLLVIGHSFVRMLEESLGDALRTKVSATFRDVKGIGGLTVWQACCYL